jgi:hypothetical protein
VPRMTLAGVVVFLHHPAPLKPAEPAEPLASSTQCTRLLTARKSLAPSDAVYPVAG